MTTEQIIIGVLFVIAGGTLWNYISLIHDTRKLDIKVAKTLLSYYESMLFMLHILNAIYDKAKETDSKEVIDYMDFFSADVVKENDTFNEIASLWPDYLKRNENIDKGSEQDD